MLALEILIALCVHDKIVRPYGGDVLAPIFLYCLVRSFFCVPVKRAAFSVLLVSYLIECLQYFHVLNLLGWQRYRLVAVLLGNHFEWADLLAYTGGVGLALLAEQLTKTPRATPNELRGSGG
ncbi:DUF2809 domain-containing protein [Hymenobacter monticola]|uniref:DUF2809 domain-containing protein n=1 Tax=Hymenobacter monticola TaxID=1705399 RepID=A0ABY4B2T1_9BACT|nr:DUF2809 domain-containing protein [Hymenobacter monticola]UOE32672.1 DUF2809 domain-containing protein [Hymenobacter monticola]